MNNIILGLFSSVEFQIELLSESIIFLKLSTSREQLATEIQVFSRRRSSLTQYQFGSNSMPKWKQRGTEGLEASLKRS